VRASVKSALLPHSSVTPLQKEKNDLRPDAGQSKTITGVAKTITGVASALAHRVMFVGGVGLEAGGGGGRGCVAELTT
jgi:hypothetical protein